MKEISLLLFSLLLNIAVAQTTFYNPDTIQKIEIHFNQSNWDYQMDTAKSGADSYTFAAWVKVNGVQFDSVGVKYKGNSSYNSTNKKNSLHIELDHFKNQSYQGIKDIKLGNGYGDPSQLREVLSYNILKDYMDCPRANFAVVYINGVYWGLYSNAESINKAFCSDRFYSSQNTFLKCNPIINPGPNTKSNLKYINSDTASYFNYYELKSTTGWKDVVTLCDSVTNNPTSVGNIMDIDRIIWMLAFNNVLVNLDSYSGVFAQNYYLYKDNTNRYVPIVWDLNMCLGGFPFVGSGNSSMGSLTVANMQQLSPTIHSTDIYWPLIKAVVANAAYKRMYTAHMRTILNEAFVSGNYMTSTNKFQALIDTSVVADTNNFFSYTQFQNAITTNTTVGSYTVPGINTLMSSRINYLQGLSDFTATPPVISNISPTPGSPVLNNTVTITAQITTSNVAYFNYRYAVTDKFTRVPLLDDGLHNDGIAGDMVYGTTFTMQAPLMQYYIYAENSNAGMFAPERAEHEFYTLQAAITAADSGQVFINEFLASNTTSNVNENNQHADWLELYNTTNTPLILDGLYLSDDTSNLKKFSFPINTVIKAKGVLPIWADQNVSTPSAVHCNFKLSAAGDKIILSNGNGKILDSVYFGVQSSDISMGRCPDGTGAFKAMNPSFNTENCPTGINTFTSQATDFVIFPVPTHNQLNITSSNSNKINSINIVNYMGQSVFLLHSDKSSETIELSNLPTGVYFVKINGNFIRSFEVIH